MTISVSLPWSSSLCTSEGQTAAGRGKADKTTPCQALAETIQVINTDVACDRSTFPVLFTHLSSEGFGVLHTRCFDRSFTAQTKDKLLLHTATKESQIQPRAWGRSCEQRPAVSPQPAFPCCSFERCVCPG